MEQSRPEQLASSPCGLVRHWDAVAKLSRPQTRRGSLQRDAVRTSLVASNDLRGVWGLPGPVSPAAPSCHYSVTALEERVEILTVKATEVLCRLSNLLCGSTDRGYYTFFKDTWDVADGGGLGPPYSDQVFACGGWEALHEHSGSAVLSVLVKPEEVTREMDGTTVAEAQIAKEANEATRLEMARCGTEVEPLQDAHLHGSTSDGACAASTATDADASLAKWTNFAADLVVFTFDTLGDPAIPSH